MAADPVAGRFVLRSQWAAQPAKTLVVRKGRANRVLLVYQKKGDRQEEDIVNPIKGCEEHLVPNRPDAAEGGAPGSECPAGHEEGAAAAEKERAAKDSLT